MGQEGAKPADKPGIVVVPDSGLDEPPSPVSSPVMAGAAEAVPLVKEEVLGKDRPSNDGGVVQVGGADHSQGVLKETVHTNQETQEGDDAGKGTAEGIEVETRNDEHVAMVIEEEEQQQVADELAPKGEVMGAGQALSQGHENCATAGSDQAAKSQEGESKVAIECSNNGEVPASPTSTIPFLNSFSSSGVAAWKPGDECNEGAKDAGETAKLAQEGDSSAYDDLPPLEKLQKDTSFMEEECLGDCLPNSGPTDLMDATAAGVPETEDSNIQHELLHTASPVPAVKSVKTGRFQFYTPRKALSAVVSSQKDKAHVVELSLRHVLSDPISGSLMDDAMVAQCGHSFGHASLQRVIETNICTSCGASVPSGSLVPNLALRAAVLAFRREDQLAHPNTPKGSKRRRDQLEPLEGPESKRPNRSQEQPSTPVDSYSLDGSRPRGVQFPFVVSDRVLIKGNKRTPERFVGREAVITTQCLNGWYMVQTVDSGESVRLQYRSLQKLGDTHVSPDSETGGLSPPGAFSPAPRSFFKESPESSPVTVRETRAGSSAPLVPSKGLRTDYQKKLNRSTRKSVSRTVEATAATSSPSGMSSNSSREVSADQGTGSKSLAEHSKLLVDIADEARDAVRDQKLAQSGGEPPDGGREQDSGGDSFTTRSKRSVVHSRGSAFNTSTVLADPDPYRKVYTSGLRRRAFMGDTSSALMSEQAPALPDSKPPVRVSDGDQPIQQNQEAEVATNGHAGEIKSLQDASKGKGSEDILRMMRKDLLKLERMTPWSCLERSWRSIRPDWQKGVKQSSTVLELSSRVEEYRRCLLLTSAGGMSDEEWGLRLAATRQAGDFELLIPLWGRLYEDVYKWLQSKPRPNSGIAMESFHVDPEFQKHFPMLTADGMSPVAFTAAATLATADAVLSNGPKDAEALVGAMVKQLRQHNRQDLVAIREGLEREKRHVAAKLALLDNSRTNGNSMKEETPEDATLISNPEAFVTLPTPECVPIVTPVATTPMVSNRVGAPLPSSTRRQEEDIELGEDPQDKEASKPNHDEDNDSDAGESEAMMHLRDNDGEEGPDVSNSD